VLREPKFCDILAEDIENWGRIGRRGNVAIDFFVVLGIVCFSHHVEFNSKKRQSDG
jgi:hypothetical protein